jgi:phosphoribosyl 1,2-cyclic phosphodiesterase
MDGLMKVRFEITAHGTRGTLPLPLPGGSVYGVNSACVAVRHPGGLAVLDAGTGIVPFGWALHKGSVRDLDIILSHAHYDHVLGLPFFTPLHDPAFRITLWYAGGEGAADGRALLDALMRPPFLPFGRRDLRASVRFAPLPTGGAVALGGGTRLVTAPVCHPGGALALRLEAQGAAFVHVPDFEMDGGEADAALIEFLRGADLVFLDSTYTPEDYDAHRGFGHAHWEGCARIAAAAGLARCGLFHHACYRTDAELAAVEAAAQAANTALFLVREGETFRL